MVALRHVCGLGVVLATAVVPVAVALELDESPATAQEWGYHPAPGAVSAVTPPSFSWRPQAGAASYEVQCSRRADFTEPGYAASGIVYNVHCPARVLEPGAWHWRYRAVAADGTMSGWSQVRSFSIAAEARAMPLPTRGELLSRVPKAHPRLFVRPEQIEGLRQRAQTDLKPLFDGLVKASEALLASPPPTAEPATYPKDMERNSEEWRKLWWGNRVYTIKALDGAATLAFTRLIGGRDEYGQEARRILMECARWDPKGATGYRYNDEAGMPYNSRFARTYSFVYDLLSEDDRKICREVMAVRGEEMHRHLYPRHLWSPYSSHSNRAWHFLGEVGLAFLDEIPEAGEWVWFAANVFANVYPVWSDEDGGWHEGMAYWNSYIERFTWWADIMHVAMGVKAYDKPYFSRIGDYALYMQPPGTVGGGLGDLVAERTSSSNLRLMEVFAAQAGNPYWQWYVEAHGGAPDLGGYVGFLRGALPAVAARPPLDLPTSKCFRGTGQAVLNATLLSAADNVGMIFKSSPFGTQSHGYDSQNSFALYAYGERLLVPTGRRDSYGTPHHRNWMWQTKSTNSITVNGRGQGVHSAAATGRIVDFVSSDLMDYVAGDATTAYEGRLKGFTRRVLFIKPDTFVMVDALAAPEPSSFEWLLHAPVPMTLDGQDDIRVVNGRAACRVALLWPRGLAVTQTDQFDPPPRARIKLTEYHLTAATPTPQDRQTFVSVIQVHRADAAVPSAATLEEVPGGFAVTVPQRDGGKALVLCRAADTGTVAGHGFQIDGAVGAVIRSADGTERGRFVAAAETLPAAAP
ncbi:MAG: DUF4962 domain-containing protein [Lentisphaerae bacterium]|nr:DUF4962 domain-containing protein [Lentisphaerota bacterium]